MGRIAGDIIFAVVTEVIVPILMGVALSAACGIRAFLPLLILSLASLGGYVDLNPAFERLGTPEAAIIFGVAVVLELLGDKIPVVDHVLDVIGAFIKPAAATIIVAGLVKDWDPLLAIILGLIAGGGVAATVHTAKAGIRVASTALTAGTANVFISFAEDFLAVICSAIAVYLPVLGAVIAAILVFILVRWMIKNRTRTQASQARGKAGSGEGKGAG